MLRAVATASAILKFAGTLVPFGITVVTVYVMFSPIVPCAAVLPGRTGVAAALAIVTLRVTTLEKLSAAGTFAVAGLAVSMLLAGV